LAPEFARLDPGCRLFVDERMFGATWRNTRAATCLALLSMTAPSVALGSALEQCSSAAGCSALPIGEELAHDSILLQSMFSVGSKSDGADAMRNKTDEDDEEDWMLEETLAHEWLSGGGASDREFNRLSEEEREEFAKAAHHAADEIAKEGQEEASSERQAWVEKFQTEHQAAVKQLRAHPTWRRMRPLPCRRVAGAGEISGLYTYGAPGAALSPLINPQRKDGKMPGMRVMTQRLEMVRGILRVYHDPFSFFAGLVGHKHAHMDALVLSVNKTAPQVHRASWATSLYPRSDMAFWTRGHKQDTYEAALLPHKDTFDPKVHEMLFVARAVDPSVNKYSIEKNAEEARQVGWNLVAQSTSKKLHAFDVIHLDNTSLFQDPATQRRARWPSHQRITLHSGW